MNYNTRQQLAAHVEELEEYWRQLQEADKADPYINCERDDLIAEISEQLRAAYDAAGTHEYDRIQL